MLEAPLPSPGAETLEARPGRKILISEVPAVIITPLLPSQRKTTRRAARKKLFNPVIYGYIEEENDRQFNDYSKSQLARSTSLFPRFSSPFFLAV